MKHFTALFFVVAVCAFVSPASGQEREAAVGSSVRGDPKPGKVSKSNRGALKGRVSNLDVTLQSIKDLRLDLKRVRGAANDIFDEVTRQPINYQMQPNVVGTMVINIPVNIQESQLLEPRKEWIDNSAAKMGPIIELLRKDVESINIDDPAMEMSDETRKRLKPLTQDWIRVVKSMYNRYEKLKPLLGGSTYDNTSISQLSRGIYLDARRLEKTRGKAFKLLRKEVKIQRRAAKGKK